MTKLSKPGFLKTFILLAFLGFTIFAMKIGYDKARDVHSGEIIGKVYTVRCDEKANTCTTSVIYSVNNVEYRGSVTTPNPSPHTINKEITLYYDPKNPADVVLSAPPVKLGYTIILISMIVFVNIFWYLYVQFKIWRYLKSIVD